MVNKRCQPLLIVEGIRAMPFVPEPVGEEARVDLITSLSEFQMITTLNITYNTLSCLIKFC